MATIQYTADDGSVVAFVDPAGVQVAVDTALAAQAGAPVVTETDTGITVTHSDGTTTAWVTA